MLHANWVSVTGILFCVNACGGASESIVESGGTASVGGNPSGTSYGGNTSSVSGGGGTAALSSVSVATGGAPVVDLTMPAECQVAAGGTTGSRTVTFRVQNNGTSPIGYSKCASMPQIYSCEDGYQGVVPISEYYAITMMPCGSTGGSCGGGCEETSMPTIPVGGGDILTGSGLPATWAGQQFIGAVSAVNDPCSCYYEAPAATGKYRATFVVYDVSDTARANGRTLSADFTLPDDDGVVTFVP